MSELRGVIPPATTPFDARGEMDVKAVSRQIDWLISAGVQGVAVGGSTGEGHTITGDEFHELIAERTRVYADSRIDIEAL